ncbi:hypothetical protein ACHWQZ_G010410 [Mnemiopsis leidyi]
MFTLYLTLLGLGEIVVSHRVENRVSSEGDKVVEVNGFLKLETADNQFRCWDSNLTYTVTPTECLRQTYSQLCDEDPYFYQACGAVPPGCYNQYSYSGVTLCGLHVCQYRSTADQNIYVISGNSVSWYFDCNRQQNCINPENPGFDEKHCDISDDDDMNFECAVSGKIISRDKTCDGKGDCLPHLSNDEANCNHKYGVECMSKLYRKIKIWLPPAFVCDNNTSHYSFHCLDDIDEVECDQTVGWCYWQRRRLDQSDGDMKIRKLVKNQMCSPDQYGLISPCIDGRDQLNCTSSHAALTCKVDSYPTTVTKLGLCRGFPICDDAADERCREVEMGCNTHKHTLCDDVPDCPRRGDELQTICKNLVREEHKCVRNVNYGQVVEKRIPVDWLCDGEEDCQGGVDEDETFWKRCGSVGTKVRCIEKEDECGELFRCDSRNDTELVELTYLCDGILSCRNEEQVCKEARSREMGNVPSLAPVQGSTDTTLLLQCVPGLVDLSHSARYSCSEEEFLFYPKGLGLRYNKLNIPSAFLPGASCHFLYGEPYVYMTCMDQCPGVPCPLKPLIAASCLNVHHRIFTMSLEKTSLVMVKRKSGGGYENEKLFPCDNGICVTLDKVCNLANDCGDNSDEMNCVNHFQCGSGEFVPISKKCDGGIHCRDGSDECNDLCSLRIISTLKLRIFAWFAGMVAIVVNGIVIGLNIRDLMASKSGTAFLSNSLLTVIAVGDFFIGIYLISIAAVDTNYGGRFCRERYEWLISKGCSILGVINTLGMQLSLFSMMILSIFRAVVVHRKRPSTGVTKKDYFYTLAVIVLVVSVSVFISTIPLFPTFEDFFLNGLYYGTSNPLLIGVPDKTKHMKILEAYYGRLRSLSSKDSVTLDWTIIRRLIRDMFTQDHGGIVGRDWGFYGNAPACVFKFFVKRSDPQLAYSWGLLGLNFTCFVLIAGSYTFVNFKSVQSIHVSGSKGREKTRKLQRKIALIIATDFVCWVPFIVIALLHFLEIVNGTKLYIFCSTILLPINSILNPLLYQNKVVDCISSCTGGISSAVYKFNVKRRLLAPNNQTLASSVETFNFRKEEGDEVIFENMELNEITPVSAPGNRLNRQLQSQKA